MNLCNMFQKQKLLGILIFQLVSYSQSNQNFVARIYLLILLFLSPYPTFSQNEIKIKEKRSKFGLYKGRHLITDILYDELVSNNDRYLARVSNKWGVIGKTGESIIPINYDSIHSYYDFGHIIKQNNRYGVLDTLGNVLIPIIFDQIDHFNSDTSALVKKGEEWLIWKNGPVNPTPEQFAFWHPEKHALFEICDPSETDFEKIEQCSKEKMLHYIYRNLRYPHDARENGIQGCVVISFLISPEGIPCCYRVERPVHISLETVSLKIIKSINQWVPATNEGVAVWCRYIIPVAFRLE